MAAKLVLEYDGSDFAGWARQPDKRTIQGEVERALAMLLRQSAVAVTVAGRTDKGVHAWGQVASYAGAPVPVPSLNAILPADIAALSCTSAPAGFDARWDATSRAYCYRLLTRPGRSALEQHKVLHWRHPIDLGALQECARALLGEHDFTAFTPTDTKHHRFERNVFAARWQRTGADRLDFWIEANSFMRSMNRVLVGTMLEVAQERRTVSDFIGLLGGAPRSKAGPTAPPDGLYLAGVGYAGERIVGRDAH